MTTIAQNSSGSPVILLLSGSNVHAQADRKLLRKLGYETLPVRQKGAELAGELPGADIGLIVCDERLADMSGLDFVRLIRLHPALRELPLLFVSTDNTRNAVLEAKSAGCSGYLLRPYSQGAFAGQVERCLAITGGAVQDESSAGEADASAFYAALHAYLAPPPPKVEPWLDALDAARALFARRRYDEATAMFRQSLALKPEQPEARLGLARIWRAKGFLAEYREDMERAATLFAREGRLDEASRIVEELRRFDPHLKDPRRHVASGLIRSRDFQAAAKALSTVIETEKDAGGLYTQIARDCLFTDNPMQTARGLCDALAQTADPSEARKLWQRIAGDEPRRTDATLPARQAATDSTNANGVDRSAARFTVWRDVLAVARYTFSAYRSGGAQERA